MQASQTSAAGDQATTARIRIDSGHRWFPDVRVFLRANQLLRLLARRDVTVKYRQTVLGAIWIVVGPLASAGLFTFVFGSVADLPSEGQPYFAFSYAALLAWNLFADTMLAVSRSLTNNAALLTKIYFPRLVLPVSSVLAGAINAAISLAVMAVLLLAYGIGFTANLLLLPVWLLLAVGLALGVGLALAAVAVSYRDVGYITQVAVPLLLFLTPVAYSLDSVPDDVRGLYLLNPVATLVEGCRWSVLGTGDLSLGAIAYAVAATVVVLAGGMAVFSRLEWSFADVV